MKKNKKIKYQFNDSFGIKVNLTAFVLLGLLTFAQTNLYGLDNLPSLDFEKITTQQKEIKGIVKDTQGNPLLGVNILVKGTSKGTQTDFDGKYTISVNNGDKLVFSYLGMREKTITVTNQTTINVVLEEDTNSLEEIVVTALGIKKEKKRVGYAVQEVKGAAIQKAVTPNIVESLTGKVAGLIVTNNSSDFFSDPKFYLRGSRPLMVVDGVPQTNSDIWNLSSDDVESITVLKSGAASALYGSPGRNGAIQLTLKSGKNAKKGVVISYNSSTLFQGSFIRVPGIQTQYGPGNNGVYRFGGGFAGGDGLTKGGGINDFDYSIWGPKFDGRLIVQYDSPIDPNTGFRKPTPWVSRGPNNLKNFMEVGLVTSHNVTVQANSDVGSFVVSNTFKHSKASTPGQRLDINTTRLRGSLNLSDKFTVDGSIQYNYQFSDNRIRGGYAPQSPIYNLAIWGGAHFDIRNFKQYWEKGKEGIRQNYVEHWRFNNPYALAYAYKRPWTKNDLISYLKFTYKFSDHLSAYVRSTLNAYTQTDNEKISKDIYTYSISDRGGRFRYSNKRFFENNTDFLISYNNDFLNDDLNVSATLGVNQRYFKTHSESGTTGQLIVPEIFTLQNSVDNIQPSSYKEQKGVYSGYYTLDFAYKDKLFVGATGRVDKTSTLPSAGDTFFYPSLYSSLIISEMFDLPEFVNFFKVRAAVSQVGSDQFGGVYGWQNQYGTGRYRNLPTAGYPGLLENPNLKPSYTNTYEYGFETRMFSGRLGIDFSYYRNRYGPQIFTQSFSSASGWSGVRENGRETERRGIDFSITGSPIRSENLNWTTIFNFATYKNYLISLPPLEDGTVPDREGRTYVGEELNHYWYGVWDRSPDGQLIIGANGLPVGRPAIDLGNTLPDFTASINNTIQYKDVSLSFLIDGRFGGVTFDRYNRDLWRSGSHTDAIHPERELSNIAFATGGDARTMQIPGVSVVSGEVTYDAEGAVLTDTRVYEPSTAKVSYPQWASNYKGDWRSNIIEKTFVKLREVTLTYNIPKKTLEKTFLNSASVSLIGRNLFYWTKDDTFNDLDTYTVSGGDTDLQLPSQRSYGFNINLQF
ncbi:SusC/RagA family TonB-linked outer membrane protein [Polaribacter cellanae]|uniref:SusC/RagA family TonB-linked outer membrane protein n=1 Tax=Polaribacter cellanae TaxID=2818493 RepID=A0A975CQL1_9FLAO|nr:SusC/RagA family TonB-linked outer membrane protein [Polaribacter cellanae]QTE23689.1 SusC/RagA family TonB-linked outer membrane protein [Polaribacter cellanae]